MIYIDNDYMCHTTNPDGVYTPVETPPQLVGKCAAYIEGYRFIPAGASWSNPKDGYVFQGETITPWRDIALLEEFQTQYEAQLAAAEAAYEEGVNTAYD